MSRTNACSFLAPVVLIMAAGRINPSKADVDDAQSAIRGRIVAIGIPGVSAIGPVGTFLPGGPIHDNPAFAAYTAAGRVLDPGRILVGSRSNFGAPLANPDEQQGAFLSIDPRGAEI